MKKFLLLLTLIATTFSAWGAISVDSLFLAGACTLNSSWDNGRLNLYKNGSVYTYIGYFYGSSSQGFKMPTSHVNNTTCVRPKSNSSTAVTVEATRGKSYDIVKSNSPDHKFRVSQDGWYSFTIDLANEKFSVASLTYPSVIYPLGSGTKYGWGFSKAMNETSTGSGKYEGYVDFKASSNQEMKFACMYGNDKTMIGAKTSGTNINGPGSYAAKHYNVYAEMKSYNNKGQVNFSKNDVKFKVNLSSDVTYFVRVDLTNSSNDYTVTIKQKPTFSIATTAVTGKVGSTFTRAMTTGSDGTKSYTSSDTKVATVDGNGVVTMKAAGTATITAKVAESNTYGPMSDSYTVTVERYLPELAFAEASKTVCKNAASFINPLQNKGNGKVTYSGGSEGVATIAADGTITVKGAGSTSFTATSEETALYSAGNATFNLTVTSDLTPSPLALVDITVTKTKDDLQKQYSWTVSGNPSYLDFKVNNAIRVLSTTGNAKCVDGYYLRYYQNNDSGKFTIKGEQDIIIKSAAVNYSIQNQGVMTKIQANSGKSVGSNYIAANAAINNINSNSIKLYTSNIDNRTDGRIDVSGYTIVYNDPHIVFEQFTDYPTGGGNHSIAGDNGIYKWKINAQNRTQPVGAYSNCIKLQYEDTIASDGVLEGGIKTISFDWRPTGADFPSHFIVKAGDVVDDFQPGNYNDYNCVLTYSKEFNIDSNVVLTIINPAEESPKRQNYPAIGPVHITPYLLFNVANHADTFDIEDGTTCDLNSALINNTGATPSFTILENKAGGNPSITNGILDFGSVTKKNGTIKVQAAWEGVTTTLTLTINMKSPGISFDRTKDTVKILTETYKQELNKGLSSGAVTYSIVDAPAGATIDPSTGEVTFSTAGNYVVKGKIASVSPYAEDSATYTLTVEKNVGEVRFAESSIEKDVMAAPFINPLTVPAGFGAVTYTSDNTNVATVDAKGYVTVHAAGGPVTITANVAEGDIYLATSATYSVTVTGTVPQCEQKATNTVNGMRESDWVSEKERFNVPIDEVVTISNGKYYETALPENRHFRYYYQEYKYSTGRFTLQAKPGVIIQSVKFTYTANNNTVLSDVYCYGENVPSGHEFISGTAHAVDANAITFYVGKTSGSSASAVNVTAFEVKYFDPQVGVAVTKHAGDLGKQYGLVNDKCSYNLAINNAITLHADNGNNTLKYYSNDGGKFNCYNYWGPIDILARPGTTIRYVKITYANGDGVLTKNEGGGLNLSASQYIASDSILFVNANSLRLYIGSKGASYQTVSLTKFYVVYSDATSQIETFETTPANWTLTNCTAGNERIYYDQSVRLNTNGKVSTSVPEGGIKEVSFDWQPNETSKKVVFDVKAGNSYNNQVDSAGMNNIYTISHTVTPAVKANNAAFSIELATNSATSLKIGHVSIQPYLLYTTKVAYGKENEPYRNPDLIDNHDGSDPVTYSVTEGATISANGTVTPSAPGVYTITASWQGVTTTYTLYATGTINLYENENNSSVIAKNDGNIVTVNTTRTITAGMYNTFCLPFDVDADMMAKKFGEDYDLQAFTDAELSGDQQTVTINFKYKSSMQAGVPYLLKTSATKENPTFENVMVKNTTGGESGSGIVMKAIMNPTHITPGDHTHMIVVSGDQMAWLQQGDISDMKGMRAYFHVQNQQMQVALRNAAPHMNVNTTDTPTGTEHVNANVNASRKMIIDNQFVIIREGKMYNAQGQIVK